MEIMNPGEIPPPTPPEPLPGDFKTLADQALRDAREKWNVLWEEGEKFVRHHPGKAVLAALGTGFLLGILLKD